MYRAIAILILLTLPVWIVTAEPVKMDEEKWKELSEQLDYSEEPEVQEVVREYETQEYEDAPDFSPNVDMSFVRMIALVLVIAILISVLVYILDKDFFNRITKKQHLTINIEDPDYLDISDLERALNQCLADGDYRSATRIYYLLLLERLDALKQIRWKKAKTNRQYIIEVKDRGMRKELRVLTRMYEDVWFGEHELGRDVFVKWESRFKSNIKGAK